MRSNCDEEKVKETTLKEIQKQQQHLILSKKQESVSCVVHECDVSAGVTSLQVVRASPPLHEGIASEQDEICQTDMSHL